MHALLLDLYDIKYKNFQKQTCTLHVGVVFQVATFGRLGSHTLIQDIHSRTHRQNRGVWGRVGRCVIIQLQGINASFTHPKFFHVDAV